MHLSLIQWIVMTLVLVLEVAVFCALIIRKLRSKIPIFFNYVAFGLATYVLQLAVGPHVTPVQYFYLYWTTEALAMGISFAVILEVFLLILKPYPALIDFGKMLFGWAAVFLLLASLITAVVTAGTQASKICAAVILLQRIVQLMQFGLLLLFLGFESRLGLSWRSLPMCIVLGMGLFAGLDLGGSFVKQHFPGWSNPLSLVSPLISVGVLFAWFICFLLPEPQRRAVQDSPGRLILQRWNEALLATPLVRRTNEATLPVESFLPGVERAVERVMARRISS